MKVTPKDTEKVISIAAVPGGAQSRLVPRLAVSLIVFVSVTYVAYTLKLVSSSRACHVNPFSTPTTTTTAITTTTKLATTHRSLATAAATSSPSSAVEASDGNRMVTELRRGQLAASESAARRTEIGDVFFGIAASAKLWEQRKNYTKLWFRPEEMKGIVWLDTAVGGAGTAGGSGENLPPVRISGDTAKFAYRNRRGHRSAVRISRIVSEMVRLGAEGVRWFVMGDDDTVFVTENLVRVLRKYDHNQFYYIGSSSESHLQNIYFSYAMAYGGGGFAISYPLAVALEKMQDRCIQRYPGLYGSDDRMQACMAELGVPLTKELGFHQYDVYGNLFGLLAAHPVAPLVSMHHLDVVEPILPDTSRLGALQRLTIPMKLDSAGLLQHSICYNKEKGWTISVSWGFAIQIFRGIFSPREIEMPSRTFLNWYRRADYTAYAFNTRPVSRNPCQKPFVFHLSKAGFDASTNQTVSEYVRHHVPHPACHWKMANPSGLEVIKVYKRPDPHLWERAPRRNCCRVLNYSKKGSMVVDVGVCRDGEISEV